MFIGFGITFSMIAATAYTAETLPVHWRGWGVGLLGDLYYVGMMTTPCKDNLYQSLCLSRRIRGFWSDIRHCKHEQYMGMATSICTARRIQSYFLGCANGGP